MRAVHEHGIWRLHIVCNVEIDVPDAPGNGVAGIDLGICNVAAVVCNVEIDVPDAPGNGVAGIDLGICNVAAVSFGDEGLLYPGGALKEDDYYFAKKRAECDESSSREARRLDQKRTDRRMHFLHALSKHIVQQCVERGVGTIVVGDLGG
ncbi:transposase, IS605 OrfB family protein, partial [Halococcus morrhuae DSM 1307]